MRLPVLMYHDVTLHSDKADFLTIPAALLEQQLCYIQEQGYTTISLLQFHRYLTKAEALPPKPILLTFDDGYKSNLTLLYPLLRQYEMRACIFLVSEFLRQASLEDTGKYLTVADLKEMDSDHIDFGYHSFSHNSYGDFSIAEAAIDLQKMNAGFREMKIDVVPLFAYPYGASPRRDAAKMAQLQQVFGQQDIEGAFRIGNRLCSLPVNDKYQLQRIDVRGTDSFRKFKLMLRFGKKWLG